jgi:hypothetical protein
MVDDHTLGLQDLHGKFRRCLRKTLDLKAKREQGLRFCEQGTFTPKKALDQPKTIIWRVFASLT